jgi:hypothetical protein
MSHHFGYSVAGLGSRWSHFQGLAVCVERGAVVSSSVKLTGCFHESAVAIGQSA